MENKIQEYLNSENNILKCETSYRGGGCEWDLTDLSHSLNMFKNEETITCAVYQNYLGGGLQGSIIFSGIADQYKNKLDFSTSKIKQEFYDLIKKEAINYFYGLQYGSDQDYYESEEENWERPQNLLSLQNRARSGY